MTADYKRRSARKWLTRHLTDAMYSYAQCVIQLYDEHKRTPNSHLGDRSLPNVAQNARGSNLVHVEQSLPDTQLQILEEHAFLIKVLAILAS